jgi:predicted ATPase
VFFGGFLFQLGRNVRAAHEIGEGLLRLGHGRSDITARMMSHRMLGMACWHLGRQGSARANLEQALALYDRTRHRSMDVEIAGASGTCLQYLSNVLTLLGLADRAVPIFDAACADLAESIAARPRAPQISTGYFNFCVHQQLRRDLNLTDEHANRLIEFASRNGLGPWSAAGLIWQGWVRFSRGEREIGAAQMRKGLADYRGAGTPHVLYYFLAMVADVEARLGHREAGLALLTEATEQQDGLSARCFASDLLRIKGDLLALSAPSEQAEAEACYRAAIGLAREQEALVYELRAAVSLGRLWCDQGRKSEPFDVVAPIYDRFTEGFDTADLVEAKTLLDELR